MAREGRCKPPAIVLIRPVLRMMLLSLDRHMKQAVVSLRRPLDASNLLEKFVDCDRFAGAIRRQYPVDAARLVCDGYRLFDERKGIFVTNAVDVIDDALVNRGDRLAWNQFASHIGTRLVGKARMIAGGNA
ncbi:hypothetical protein [Burkholderia ubonensis]|uniref:hypothetical protein n=1 Tax=Burkholderia ubonensis TaxID=101571 RepID=UPI0012F893C2|nr:hypothetical protein [Burkholderia ubonensis]